jgi:hypothetical protein
LETKTVREEKRLAIHRSGFWDADAKVPRPAQVLDARERPRVVDQQPAHTKTRIACRGGFPLQGRERVIREIGDEHVPGLCVIMNAGFEASATACGVTPHAQNTGTSPLRIPTKSPQSGFVTSAIPICAGSPT